MEPKSFQQVFASVPIPRALSRQFEKAVVRNITIQQKQKQMSLDLTLEALQNEQDFIVLREALQKQFPYFAAVDVKIQYDLQGAPADQLSAYWPQCLSALRLYSSLCHTLLKDAPMAVSEDSLSLTVPQGGSFLLQQKRMDVWLEKLLAERLGREFRVAFADSPPTREKQKYYQERERELLYENQLAPPAAGESPTPKEAAATSTKPDKPNKPADRPPWEDPAAFNKSGKPGKSGWEGGGRGRGVKYNAKLAGETTPLSSPLDSEGDVLVSGAVFFSESRETKSGRVLTNLDITDGTGSITVKFFAKPEALTDEIKALCKKGSGVTIKGKVQFDEYAKEWNIMASELGPGAPAQSAARTDDAPEKRVELHLHTQMSAMDAVTSAKTYIKRAAAWGHKAIAITDHGVVQAFPEAMEAANGTDIKVIYGVEAYLVHDLGNIVQSAGTRALEGCFVVFDIETTGLHNEVDKITEIGAVKIENGQIVDRFGSLVNPGVPLKEEITALTGITDAMLRDASSIDEVLPQFLAFAGPDATLVAHNASFDMGFISRAAKAMGLPLPYPVLDTLELARLLFPELKKHKLNIVAEHIGVSLENHHRAVDDATATGEILLHCLQMLKEQGILTLQDVNVLASRQQDKKKLKTYHAVILAQNYTGLRNLYELISLSHIDYFYKRPRIPKSEFLKRREGLLIGTACEAGEFYKAVRDGQPDEVIRELAEFYDYFEIQPIGNNMYMLREGMVPSVQTLMDYNKRIVALGEAYGKPVVAACDVHFIDPEDEIYRRIIMAGDGFKDADNQPPLYFRTTEEMLAEFSYLPPEKAREIVIDNPNRIADGIEAIKPIPDETFPPYIEGSEEQLEEITVTRAKALYGDPLPPLVQSRLYRELTSIIKNGFAVMYIIAQRLVWKSLEDGYLVGSRGSIGSSFVATMANITEVNPLPPHYLCPQCQYSDFDSPEVQAYTGSSGCDMPDKLCPKCGAPLDKDGHDIPFETFLGFDGDKEPDIDLNFSGEYQARAHAYTEELFGTGHVFKAGTIGTLADKTAYGYVKKYAEERNLPLRGAEVNRLKDGCTGIRRTTGQHPGGLMVVPNGHDIHEFCPIQRPANDMNSSVTTTHFDYHSISGRLLKLDLLGHDVPTIIRMLQDITGLDPTKIPLAAPLVMTLFTSPAAMGLTPEDICGVKTGSLGLPEFGTNFVRQMLLESKPNTFADLVRISGLSHGTDVWNNNAQSLIQSGTATLKEVIACRDDIMIYLINKGMDTKTSFKIMENVRKGKGLSPGDIEKMLDAEVPEWYIESCQRIKYLFPKGHAVAYVMMTARIGYFKLHHPYAFYASVFSVKAEDFDYGTMCQGRDAALSEYKRLQAMGKEASAKDKNSLTVLELVIELYARGLKFVPMDLYKAEASKFIAMPGGLGLMAPLCSIQGLGLNVAQNIVEARKDGEFITIEDFRGRTKSNKNVIQLLKEHKILDKIPETNQLTLFM